MLMSIICCNSENNKFEKQNLEFKVNYELLNPEAVTDGNGFSMNIPINWNPLDSLSKFKIKRVANSLEGSNKLVLVNAFH